MMSIIGAVGKVTVFGLIASVSVVLAVGCDAVASTPTTETLQTATAPIVPTPPATATATPAPTATAIPPTAAATATSIPTATAIPPTATAAPVPTATAISPTATATATPTPTATVIPPTATAIATVTPTTSATAISSIFEGFEPCTRAGIEDRDPCEVRRRFGVPGLGSRILPETPTSYERLLFNSGDDDSLDDVPLVNLLAATHLVARGTFEPGSTRCASYPYLFPAWIFDEGESPYPEIPEGETVVIQGVWDLYSWQCFSTFNVGEWLVGGGPASIVVSHPHLGNTYSINDTPSIESYAEELNAFRDLIADAYEGYEWVLWLGTPPITSVLSLAAYHYWDVQRDENGTVRVVSPDFEYYDYEGLTGAELGKLNPALAEFRRDIASAHEARVAKTSGRVGVQPSTPMLVTDASMLASHFAEIGGPTNIVATPAPAPAEPGAE